MNYLVYYVMVQMILDILESCFPLKPITPNYHCRQKFEFRSIEWPQNSKDLVSDALDEFFMRKMTHNPGRQGSALKL